MLTTRATPPYSEIISSPFCFKDFVSLTSTLDPSIACNSVKEGVFVSKVVIWRLWFPFLSSYQCLKILACFWDNICEQLKEGSMTLSCLVNVTLILIWIKMTKNLCVIKKQFQYSCILYILHSCVHNLQYYLNILFVWGLCQFSTPIGKNLITRPDHLTSFPSKLTRDSKWQTCY